jgi:hypothetical protein
MRGSELFAIGHGSSATQAGQHADKKCAIAPAGTGGRMRYFVARQPAKNPERLQVTGAQRSLSNICTTILC